MSKRNLVIKVVCLFLILCSCKNQKEKILVNKEREMWHVLQKGAIRSDSSASYFKLHRDNTYDELYFFNNEFKSLSSNPDIVDYHKWAIIEDSLFEISFIKYRIVVLNDSIGLFVNLKRTEDSLLLKKYSF